MEFWAEGEVRDDEDRATIYIYISFLLRCVAFLV